MERLITRFKKSIGLEQEIGVFNECLNNPTWIILSRVPEDYSDLKKTELGEVLKNSVEGAGVLRKESTEILKTLKKSWGTKELESFTYGKKWHGICCPLLSGDKEFGVLVVCDLKKKCPEDQKKILSAFTKAVIRESMKESEIEDINKTVRPRAVALSTVHTVHRLMSSTLDLDELLPRIARLTLQVLRANRCSIKLVDRHKKVLLPKATIDLRQEKTTLKKVEIGKYAPGRAVKKGMPIRGKHYLAVPLIDEDVMGVITLYDKLDDSDFSQFDEEIMKTLAEQAAIAIKNAQLFKEQEELTLSSIMCIAQLLEDRPHGSHKAQGSFLKMIGIIGPKMKMNESEIRMVQYAAMLHDAGQISIPETVLTKKGELTGLEYDIMKSHPMKGAKVLSKFTPLKPLVPILKYHHENYDGSGYPKGLKGKDIPLAARILAVVGDFEAMITDKPYRKALSISAAIKEVKRNSGIQFDPDVVAVFCEVVDRKDVMRMLEKELINR